MNIQNFELNEIHTRGLLEDYDLFKKFVFALPMSSNLVKRSLDKTLYQFYMSKAINGVLISNLNVGDLTNELVKATLLLNIHSYLKGILKKDSDCNSINYVTGEIET